MKISKVMEPNSVTEILSKIFLSNSTFYYLGIIVSNEVETENPAKQTRRNTVSQLCGRATSS